MKAVEIKNLTVKFDQTIALKNVSLSIEEGSFLGIIGPNGGGKTTLLKVILGILRPEEGYVKVFGEDPRKFKGKIGYVPQYSNFDPEFPISVEEVVQMGRLGNPGLRSKIAEEDRKIVKKSLEKVDLWNLRKRRISDLSGGQHQRALIARALATEPEMLILDEPTTSVDQNVKNNIHALLSRLKKRGITILISTHDAGVIYSNKDSVACLNQTLVCHKKEEITTEDLRKTYGAPINIVSSEHPIHTENSEGEGS